ncbi:hypothetical protein BDN70DRAFT_871023 [Pholiota conissans]|uniref:Uncharacterized protein n=1 Tax=Pholiota conissans TaxID=109636 RepID=A0A9P5ZFH0_9AGAR|nr:hypothetical protein BDN70DRAFT_871023 [Pholiota conissans]
MLSKISKRSRRRSEQVYVASVNEPSSLVVDRPPDLLQWCDLNTPFPSVALGGYTRYYLHAGLLPKTTETPGYCPALSQDPYKTSLIDIPPKSSLFPTSSDASPRPLAIIHESSMESVHPRRPPALTVSAMTTPNSLRHKRRRLLRTPSIERDFAVHGRQFFSSSISVNEVSLSSPSSQSAHSHSSSSAHSDSTHSDSSDFSFGHMEFPLSPSTSIESESRFELDRKSLICLEETPQRPGSSASFNTAKTGFSDA